MGPHKYLLPSFVFLLYLEQLKGHVHRQRTTNDHPDQEILVDVFNSRPKEHDFTPAPPKLKPYKDVCTEDEAVCVLPVQCPAHVAGRHVGTHRQCSVIGGRRGICCASGQNHTVYTSRKLRDRHRTHMDAAAMGILATRSRIEMAEMQMRENALLSSGRSIVLPYGSASYGHFRNMRVYGENDLVEVMNVANKALEIALATRAFKDRQGLTVEEIEYGEYQDLKPTPLGSFCATSPTCTHAARRYRRLDGTCNNGRHPGWGGPLTPYSRLLPPSYQDGIWSPRVSEYEGRPLPSPRSISTTMFRDVDRPNYDYTLMVMQFGQFLSHDFTHSIDTTFANGSAISCCSENGAAAVPEEYRHFACMPIEIPKDDPFYSRFNQRCMNFVRSVLAPRYDCTLGYAQQMNKITHFIDGSVVYGSSEEQNAELRTFSGGRLEAMNDFGRELLPLSKDPDACLTMEQGSACFTSGDTRTNQMISLVVLHTIFMREHNRVAKELERLNPEWNDERLFHEARRIVVAELQAITYKEFLPAVLGDFAMEEFDLTLARDGYSYDYDQRIDPSVTNEFASAAFRFGHSTVDGLLKIYGLKHVEEMISIPEIMFHPGRMRKAPFLDELLSTLVTEPIQDVDDSISDALTKYMFRAGQPFGVDLASLNIQRGRDHGLRPYNDYRELIGLPRMKTFEEFGDDLGKKLSKVYASADDIDLWVGGLLETKVAGSIVGPTFRDIIADQFVRFKKGDKYFFDHDPSINPGHFAIDQLNEIRKVSMSRIVCDNADRLLLAKVGLNAFRKPGVPGNEYADCDGDEIPRIDLRFWQE